MALRPCANCARPVRLTDPSCPFCAAALTPAPAAGGAALTRLAGGAMVMALAASCSPPVAQPVYGAPAPPSPSASDSVTPSPSPSGSPIVIQPPYGAPMPPSASPSPPAQLP